MSHPMEGYWDARRAESDRRWERVRAMRVRLAETPALAFMADFTFAICLILEPDIVGDAGRDRKVEEALDKLEAFYARYDAEARNIDPRYADGHAPSAPARRKRLPELPLKLKRPRKP